MKRLASVLLLLELLTGCVTSTQMEMDAEVDRLCAIDGGLKIYETVSLPPEKFDKHEYWRGQVRHESYFINFYRPTQGEYTLGPEYIWKWNVKFLHPGGDSSADPRMRRDHIQILRRSDGRLLGEAVSYARIGGDPEWTQRKGYHSTHYRCPENAGTNDLIEGVFIKNETGGAR